MDPKPLQKCFHIQNHKPERVQVKPYQPPRYSDVLQVVRFNLVSDSRPVRTNIARQWLLGTPRDVFMLFPVLG